VSARRHPLERRASGVLLHPTSLPGPFGCGDLGPAARSFVERLARARQRWWQMLPVGPVGPGNSPYSSSSAFAGSALLVSPLDLARERLLPSELLGRARARSRRRADYATAMRVRDRLLRAAFAAFPARAGRRGREQLEAFAHEQGDWLEDHALFEAIKREEGGAAWIDWPEPLRRRRPGALAGARRRLAGEIGFRRFVQYQFDRQWSALRDHARRRGVGLAGDVPFYVQFDSADVWAHPEFFLLDARGRPRVVAGVAPDYFARDGQRWGNPLWDWGALERDGFSWWAARLERALARCDWVRLDHFLGFHRAWSIPASSRTARRGRYLPGPGLLFFTRIGRRLGGLPFLAEDLGTVVAAARELRDRAGLPGMRVLQFAFGSGPGAEAERPHFHPRRCAVYTGTHDNDTARGWFHGRRPSHAGSRAELRRERERVLSYLGTDGREIHWDFIRAALRSAAETAIVPLQDVLGLGSRARMNRPGTGEGNWEWRFAADDFGAAECDRLGELTETYGRASEGSA